MHAYDPQPHAHQSDADLAHLAAHGDHRAFESLMRRHNRALYRTARSIVRDDAEAEDVLQESYLLVYRHLLDFRGAASLGTWLTRIVINEATGRLRKSQRRAEILPIGPQALDDQDKTIMPDATADTPEQPEQAALRNEARRLIEANIDALPDSFRTVFVLRAVEEYTVEETAAALNLPEATVRSRHFRARALLREALAREFDHALDSAFGFDGARCDRIVVGVLARMPTARDDADT
ncbi:RNA polymerase sigma factor [Massilia arenosa]|uniref:RNA polymerase sigma factor n=1 Tax=Zemynaea arenosa TaxID=2561931 RepID=A0A4Y9SNS5_9BURK|nr:RNA polymerase sigma factor [Massilia arenosa]TFW25051.1 RNA polymerase sigma factor [Massilia arenosa]